MKCSARFASQERHNNNASQERYNIYRYNNNASQERRLRRRSGGVPKKKGAGFPGLARFPSQGRRLRRRKSGWTGTGAVLGSLCEPRAAPSAPCAWWVHEFRDQLALRAKARRLRRHRTVPVPVPVPVPGHPKMTDTSRDYRQTDRQRQKVSRKFVPDFYFLTKVRK